MGLLDGIMQSVLADVAEKHPGLTEEQCVEIVEKMVAEPLPKIAETLWPLLRAMKEECLFHERLKGEMFTKRNIFRWREGFDLMDMLAVISLEIGQKVNGDAEPHARSMPSCRERVLVRLHAKAHQIFLEIVCLLKHGLADGALGRWRALHEVAVVACLIAAHGEDLARRFFEFRSVELWNSTKVYQENAERLGLEPLSDEEVEDTKRRYEDVMSRYDESFCGNYGWAASEVKSRGKYVSFQDVERAAGINHLKPYYKWACQKIHVGCNTLYDSLGLGEAGGEQMMVAGPSNAGHCDPAQLAAISLHTAICALTSLEPSMGVVVGRKAAEMLVEKIDDTFFRIHRQLEEEEAELTREAEPETEQLGGES